MMDSFSCLASLMQAPRDSSSIVAFDHHSQIAWPQFQQHVASQAQFLQLQSGQRVALCFGNSYLFAVHFFASCYAGKVIVLPGNYQPEAVRELSAHYDVLLHDNVIAPADQINRVLINQDSLAQCKLSGEFAWTALSTEAIELTLFTSGSSGKAKAISKSLQQLNSEICLLESLWGEKMAGSRIESTVSHQHIYGLLFRLLWPLCAGRPFAIHNLEFPEQVTHRAHQDCVLISSPALLKRLSEEHNSAPLRCLFSSGGPLSTNAAQHSQTLFGHLPIEVFGSTETGGIAYRQQQTAATPWRLFPNIEADLNREQCLRLRAEHIDGNNWYQTADACHFHDTVHFDLKGRTDRIIKIEEKRVSLVEVEKRLEQLEWIEESAVVAMMDGNRLSLCAVIVVTTLGEAQLAELGKGKFWLALRQALRGWLEPIAIPRKYRIVDEIPLNSQGKRLVAEIEQHFQAE
ncbi:AMP-binding protein [Vibrio sp. NH-UV-68]|uniref:AMP-binding protein n=1 Tax=unclassified Vibrio TaxID=2614977 RepID=UPI0036F1BC49